MKTLDQMNLDGAQGIFATANTPLFLLRKLRANPDVQRINSVCDAEDILEALNRAVLHKPQTLEDMVRPYAYLVALSLNQTKSYLERGATIPAPHHAWFQYIGEVLIKTYQTTAFSVIESPPYLSEPVISFRGTSTAKQSVIIRATDE